MATHDEWRQEEPYNLQTPVTNGKQTVTGCVATAMAQVMYYHQWAKTATTAIDAPDADAPFYNLQGRRVSHPHKGIYIQNGRRVVIK